MMMDTFEAIEQRRSIKHYDPTHQMPDEDVKKLMNAVLKTPTSFNIQNYRFVVAIGTKPLLKSPKPFRV